MSAPTTTDIFTREQAKEADRVLNELHYEAARKSQRVGYAADSLRRLVDRETGWGRDREWGKTLVQAIAEVTELAATDETYIGRNAQSALDKLAEARAERDAADEAVKAQSALWAQHGRWMRYSVVPGGHIHTNWRDCHTLRPSTTVLWAYQASGDTVDEAIEVYGTVLCTHCFPDAPVANCGGKTLTDANGNVLTKAEAQAIKDAKDAEKAAKQAAKNAKAVFVPGTTDLVQGPDLRELKTEVALSRELIDAMAKPGNDLDRVHFYGRNGGWVTQADGTKVYEEVVNPKYPTYRAWIEYALEALAAKNGQTVAEVRATFVKKVEARNRRNGR